MTKPHKHAALIKAWADGAEIEYFSTLSKKFIPNPNPTWGNNIEYRIKPIPKPDVVVYGCIESLAKLIPHTLQGYEDRLILTHSRTPVDNAVFTFDGETGKLKNLEVL